MTFQIPKTKRIISPKHVIWVANHPCMLTGREAQIDPHHLLRAEQRGTGLKTGDNWTVPLYFKKHRELHDLGGEYEFFELHGWRYEDVKAYATKMWEESPFYKED